MSLEQSSISSCPAAGENFHPVLLNHIIGYCPGQHTFYLISLSLSFSLSLSHTHTHTLYFFQPLTLLSLSISPTRKVCLPLTHAQTHTHSNFFPYTHSLSLSHTHTHTHTHTHSLSLTLSNACRWPLLAEHVFWDAFFFRFWEREIRSELFYKQSVEEKNWYFI